MGAKYEVVVECWNREMYVQGCPSVNRVAKVQLQVTLRSSGPEMRGELVPEEEGWEARGGRDSGTMTGITSSP